MPCVSTGRRTGKQAGVDPVSGIRGTIFLFFREREAPTRWYQAMLLE